MLTIALFFVTRWRKD